ncbi:30S ribosomal protein S8 [Candidatus Peregrinibacteria bacterium CG10_big_fil_rev_8_21_14_0_10_49_10]|nr:MAG: 30S ribosomal protein S8 [Candidatus Peregrinibacteria bacterium CG10_big_fil_rev_8_21_14_0_10_49_10]
MTYVTDPIGDLLTRMRNAQAVGKKTCSAPHSYIKRQLCEILKAGGWIANVEETGEAPKLQILVTFAEDKPSLTLARMSTPGRRLYTDYRSLKPVLRGFGTAILTTSKGLMTDKEARAQKLGGEILCTVS